MKTKSGKFFECVVRYDKMSESGAMKKVSETYCVEADTFAEAESRIAEETAAYSDGEFDVKNITPAAYETVFENEMAGTEAIYFKAKLEFVTVDEMTLKEKKTAVYYLVLAVDFADSLKIVQEAMASTMMDYITAQITQSKVLDLFGKDEC